MNRKLLYVLVATSLLFVALGLLMIASGDSAGWMATLFFGACAAVGVVELKPSLLLPKRPDTGTPRRYPGPLVLHASRRRLIFLALLSGVFLVAGLQAVLGGDLGWVVKLVVWPGVVLFGLGIPITLVLAVKGATLRLDAEGMTISQFWRRWFLPWRDVSGFLAVKMPPAGTRLVAYDYAPADTTRMGRANRALAGRNAALSDSYGLTTEELAALLNAWREAWESSQQRPERVG